MYTYLCTAQIHTAVLIKTSWKRHTQHTQRLEPLSISRELDEKRLMWCSGHLQGIRGSSAAPGQMTRFLCVKWEPRAPVVCLRNPSVTVADRDGTDEKRQTPLPSHCRYFDVQLLSSGLWWPDKIERENERSLWKSLKWREMRLNIKVGSNRSSAPC